MDPTLDFVSRARHALHELRHPGEHDPIQPSAASGISQPANDEDGRRRSSVYPVPPIDPSVALTQFRLLVGIYQDKSFAPPRGWIMNRRPQASVNHRPAPNLGIYTSVCEKEISAKRNYKYFSRLVNACLALQLIVAAALTALGASNGSRATVTVFGAINTVIAGFLTYLKGSGLPHRLKYFQNEWARVREFIEQRERDFTLNIPGLDVREEVENVRRMYETVKQDVQTNTPERFVSVTQSGQHAPGSRPTATLLKPQASVSSDSLNRRWLSEKETEANTAVNRGQGAANGMFARFGHLKDVLEDKVKEMGQMEKDIEGNGHRAVHEKRQGLTDQIQGALREIGHLGKEMESNAKATAAQPAAQLQHEAQAAIAQSSEAAGRALEAERDAAHAAAAHISNTATDAVAAERDTAYGFVAQSSNAANNAISAQRDAALSALYGSHDPPASTQH